MNPLTHLTSYFKILLFGLIIHQSQGSHNHGVGRGLVHHLRYLDISPPGEHALGFSEDQWFEQRLDHFNAQNTKTWKQRYFSR